MPDPAAYLEVATRAARQAGDLIRAGLGQPGDVGTKGESRDFVTAVDRAAERAITGELRQAFPNAAILSEEGDGGAGVAADLHALARYPELWVVDPLDGTHNFVAGMPFSAVSIAVAQHGRVVAGVVYDPYRDELFAAAAGQGATLNGRPVRVTAGVPLGQALVATGLPVREYARRANCEGLRALSPHVGAIRAFGSAALHLAYVACGRLAAFWEILMNPWDVAAGALLVLEAGGRVTDTLGRPYQLESQHIIASAGAIHGEILYILHQAGATGYED